MLIFRQEGRQIHHSQRPNDKFKPDCWSQDSQPPPPIPDYDASEPEKRPPRKLSRGWIRTRDSGQYNPCIWESDPEFKES